MSRVHRLFSRLRDYSPSPACRHKFVVLSSQKAVEEQTAAGRATDRETKQKGWWKRLQNKRKKWATVSVAQCLNCLPFIAYFEGAVDYFETANCFQLSFLRSIH